MSEKNLEMIFHISISILILIIGYIAIAIICCITKKALKKSKIDEALHAFIANCIRIVLWIMVAITALNYLGVPISAFLTALGAAGVAVALALKDSLGNFAGGILIILSKPFSKGDYIEDYQTSGNVEKIDLLYTTLLTFDNKVITIPNGKLANSTIVNYTRADKRRVDCLFSVSSHDDISRVKDILEAVALSNEDIFQEPEPIIGVASIGQGKVDIDLKVWCKTENYWDIKYYLEEQVKIAFEEADVTMPYPRMEIQLKK